MKNLSIIESGSGGRYSLKNGLPFIQEGLATEIYIALFGGMVEEFTASQTDKHNGWYGNREGKEQLWVQSETEGILDGMVINTNNIFRLEQAVLSDMKKLSRFGEAKAAVRATGKDKVSINVEIQSTVYSYEWNETIKEITFKEEA